MKTAKTTEIFKLIPANAKAGIFILGRNDSVKKFQKLVAEKLIDTDEKLQRAIIIFEQGISSFECKNILAGIGKRLDGVMIPDEIPENVHLMGRGGFTRKEIRNLLDYYKNETETRIRIWNN